MLFEYALRTPSGDPFLLNNHRAQLRTDHQRIITNVSGEQLHESGVFVATNRVAMAAFRETVAYHHWVDRLPDGRWIDDQGRTMVPFLFPRAPWAGGGMEELDPQWQRETVTVALSGQINQAIADFEDRAERLGLVGDFRGTTLNLQVGSSASDAMNSDTLYTINSEDYFGEWNAIDENPGFRFINVTIAPGSTINTAQLQLRGTAVGGAGTPTASVYTEAADNPSFFSSGTHEPGSASLGANSQAWNISSWDSAGWNVRDSLATVVNDATSRGGWASGNAICVLIRSSTSGNNDVGYRTYDGDTSLAPKLDIDYSEAAAAKAPPPSLFRSPMRIFTRRMAA